MRDIDRIAQGMTAVFGSLRPFVGLAPAIGDFARAAKVKCETLQTDPAIFEAWSSFVTRGRAADGLSAGRVPALVDR